MEPKRDNHEDTVYMLRNAKWKDARTQGPKDTTEILELSYLWTFVIEITRLYRLSNP